jgi:hypothetical protein
VSPTLRAADFVSLNAELTKQVFDRLGAAGHHSAVIAEAPPGAGKSSLTVSVARSLVTQDASLRLPVITQTNEQADDLVSALVRRHPELRVARLVGGGSRPALSVPLVEHSDNDDALRSQIVVGTARKWEYERARLAKSGIKAYPFGLIDEAYQMRSDSLLGIADLYETLFCVGDPGQLDPFVTIDDSLWKGLVYSPARSALAVLRGYHQELDPIRLATSWRLPPSAADIVSAAFYPGTAFNAGTVVGQRSLAITPRGAVGAIDTVDCIEGLRRAAETGWAYIELPEAFTVRTDQEIAATLAALVGTLLDSDSTVADELHPDGQLLAAHRVAVVAAHNDQVFAVRYELDQLGIDPDSVVVSTANKIQGREYDVTLVWHPLAGRRDATAFHLESGRMCVMMSRHRHACVVVGRAGADRLLAEFPDSDPVFLDEPEKFPDGWEANYQVLEHLKLHRI